MNYKNRIIMGMYFTGLSIGLLACGNYGTVNPIGLAALPGQNQGLPSGSIGVIGTTGSVETTSPGSPGHLGSKNPLIGSTCNTSDSNHLCLALKYVAYSDSKGVPVVTANDIVKNVSAMNQVWSTCNIGFQVDEFEVVDPSKYNLSYNTADDSELDKIREMFENTKTLLVVTTGEWDRSGTLGNSGANAWTNIPGTGIYGVVMESSVGTYANIIAHELGHYLSLLHVNDESNLMNPIIYNNSTDISSSQCNEARSAVKADWKTMLR